ncbi:MAG: ComF family protein [Clostridia bacterium]|nr:ComF family protein [Clostridia bacterium]
MDRCTCPNKYLDTHYVHKLIKVYRYFPDDALPSNKLIYSLKRDNRKDVLDMLVEEMYCAISASVKNPSEYLFTNVPRSRKSVVKYGIDHAALLSKSLAKRFSAEYYQPLISKSKQQQKKTSGEERLKNASFDIKRGAKDLSGKKVILIDDVVTTGASLAASAMQLKALGAKQIIGAAIAIAYKDRYVPFAKGDRFLPYKK